MDSSSTEAHIEEVQRRLETFASALFARGLTHDISKVHDPAERACFDQIGRALRGAAYGSEAYQEILQKFKSAVDRHYSSNSHHPEYYPRGVSDMDLLDIVEMFCDWKASSLRCEDGRFEDSLKHNATRFGVSSQLNGIFENTRKNLDW